MIIEHNIGRFVVFGEDPLLAALQKISANKSGFVSVVSEQGLLLGMLTDGDIRRWLTEADGIDLDVAASSVANAQVMSLPVDAAPEEIAARFSSKVRAIPLVDAYGRLTAIALPGRKEVAIGDRLIGQEHPTFIIAEIGNNHNGDPELARRLIDLAADAGADCAKFQMRDVKSLYRGGGRADDATQDLGAQYTLDLLSRFNLAPDILFDLFDHSRSRGMEPMCTPWDEVSLGLLEDYGMRAYKVASADITNHDLLAAMARTGKPLICSTGMASEAELRDSVALLRGAGASFALLHCNSTYPAPYKDVNLNYLKRLAEIGDCPVGYSGHERGWTVPLASVAMGACIIEKHFTVDRGMEGNDHKVSLLPEELAAMVEGVRAIEESRGSGAARVMTQGEMMNREILAKSLHAAVDIRQGTVITDAMLAVQSPGQGIQPNRRAELVGRIAVRDVEEGTPFFPSDLADDAVEARDYRFDRPWGLPVRWHDHQAMLERSNLDLLEYHLSYKDMDANLEDWFSQLLPVDFAVHSPELFKGDHILDLASPDDAYRERSIMELQRVVDLTRALKQWHSHTGRPVIITNMGGFSTARAFPVAERAALYARMEDSLSRIDAEGVEIIPQTMPPFPWHFGGQSFHNLFMDPDEILAFCRRNRMRVCLDISHSQLACNHFNWSMTEFCEKVGPVTAHLHIVDAEGVDGEGLQIGEGSVDFALLARILARTCPTASFVPEVWQGHKDGGAGFWFALDKLEPWFGGRANLASITAVV
ncbi:N-acetylneuraminate synthase family protein [Sphingobium aquiterrae]|uniref:N-acetylneuraminate synthase family protein n=1 Tax=Sphingobium aquiterrae TaxID=2038656 RepID=UPI0030199587